MAGIAANAIVGKADAVGTDLIVVGSKGMSGARRVLVQCRTQLPIRPPVTFSSSKRTKQLRRANQLRPSLAQLLNEGNWRLLQESPAAHRVW